MMKNKRAISDMVSYTLLIVIAMSVGILVYSYLKLYLPSEKVECPPDAVMVVNEANCSISQQQVSLNITLSNRGLFNVTGAFIRIGAENRQIRSQINRDQTIFPIPIAPDNILQLYYNVPVIDVPTVNQNGNNLLEIQPAILSKGVAVPCQTGIVTFPVVCSQL